ncbi:MAG: hypothetical protein JSU08_19335 [Acidobacteria bacterium]|nr:hypothetical protein [Acidobacteriota bacterium]
MLLPPYAADSESKKKDGPARAESGLNPLTQATVGSPDVPLAREPVQPVCGLDIENVGGLHHRYGHT